MNKLKILTVFSLIICVISITSLILITASKNEVIKDGYKELAIAREEVSKTKKLNLKLESELSACQKALKEKEITDANQPNNPSSSYMKIPTINIEMFNEDTLYCTIQERNEFRDDYFIIGRNTTKSYSEIEQNVIEIDSGKGDEIVQYTVMGSIFNVELNNIHYGDGQNKEILSTLFEQDKLTDQVIRIKTSLPCGIPSEELKWENSIGDVKHEYLSADGFGFDSIIIISEP